MNNARPRNAANAAELRAAMMQQGVDKGVLVVSGGRMHNDSGGLVENQKRLVLEENFQGHILGAGLAGRASGHSTVTVWPARGCCAGLTTLPSTRIWPPASRR